MIQMLTKSLSN